MEKDKKIRIEIKQSGDEVVINVTAHPAPFKAHSRGVLETLYNMLTGAGLGHDSLMRTMEQKNEN